MAEQTAQAEHTAHTGHATHALDPHELFSHVEDSTEFHVPKALTPNGTGHLEIPQPFHAVHFTVTKFMVIELVAAILISVFFIALGKALRGGAIPRGRFRNMLEAMLLYFRDHVARPCIGDHDAERFVPFLWTMFFFVLVCNLFGMLPWMGSPTGTLAATAAMALATFITVLSSAIAKFGVWGFVKSLVPHMELPLHIKIPMLFLMFPIEVVGLLIRHAVLAVRLLANMMAGHIGLAVIVAFIAVSAQSLWWFGVMPASVLGATALSLLELFVAFLHAYIFTFLSALFIGMAVHPH
ncbi:MAG TPA: F0F1 ATP synthase subunit A [Lacipirellulaceae bacterium]|nr:F0F1 ATP synthase subunit A [Lacipirellulaceae bacterium]